jgi:hypothetical protein
MAKTIRTKRIGLFTDEQRKQIKKNKISRDNKSKLLPKNQKDSPIFKHLKELPTDLLLMKDNPVFHEFIDDYFVKRELDKLEGALDQLLRFHSIPMRMLGVSRNKNKPYYLKPVLASGSELKVDSKRRRIVTKGLKSHEKNLVLEYMKQVGYNLPLEEGKSYTWKQVRQLLTEKIEQMSLKD